MKNLENYGVQVLNASEVKSINGGRNKPLLPWFTPDLGIGQMIGEIIWEVLVE